LIDLAIIGIVVYCTWRGYRSGLIRGAFGTVALIVSLLFANIAADAYSSEFEGMLIPFVGGVVETAFSDIYSGELEYEEISHENTSDEFRSAYTVLRKIGLPVPAAIRLAEISVEDDSDRSLPVLLGDKLSNTLAYVAIFAIAFVLLAIIFAVVGNLIGFVFSLPGLKLLDMLAGIGFGFIKGVIIVLALAAFVRYFGLLAIDTLESTNLLNYLVNNNIIANILGI